MTIIRPGELAAEVKARISPGLAGTIPDRLQMSCPECDADLIHRGAFEGLAVFECFGCKGVFMPCSLVRINDAPQNGQAVKKQKNKANLAKV